jgi:uncharacterized membrane protein YhaH (DUF805 family)
MLRVRLRPGLVARGHPAIVTSAAQPGHAAVDLRLVRSGARPGTMSPIVEVDVMESYLKVLREYATFSGRARRREYWMFVLVNIIVAVALSLIDGVLFDGAMLLSGLYWLAILVPSLAVGVRRLHDTGRSGWWLLISLVPVVGGLVLFVFTVLDGDPGPNAYGP